MKSVEILSFGGCHCRGSDASLLDVAILATIALPEQVKKMYIVKNDGFVVYIVRYIVGYDCNSVVFPY